MPSNTVAPYLTAQDRMWSFASRSGTSSPFSQMTPAVAAKSTMVSLQIFSRLGEPAVSASARGAQPGGRRLVDDAPGAHRDAILIARLLHRDGPLEIRRASRRASVCTSV